MTALVKSDAWQQLQLHHAELLPVHMRQLFAEDSQRFEKFNLSAAGLFLDYSKNRITVSTMNSLMTLALQQELPSKISALFSGAEVNVTERRAALHTALRNRGDAPIVHDGMDVMPDVRRVLAQMREFTEAVRGGNWKGRSGQAITDVVNIGIGGSDLGPLMACEALKKFATDQLRLHFVSNVDGTQICETLSQLNPDTTLFIIASKTFTTQETLTNAHTARNWFLSQGGAENEIAKHFVALSTNSSAVQAFGIDSNNMFEFWDWVGGRYSMWSAIGLSIALSIGMNNFEAMLDGAYQMDQHFQSAELNQNMPVILALLTVWYSNFFGASSHLIAPYDQYLHRFPAYLQQLTMESNGKSVSVDGQATDYVTGPIVWGEPGTNGQHAFFQLVHQGTHLIPADFIVPLESLNEEGDHHEILLSHCFAQTEALMLGKDEQDLTLEMEAAGAAPDEIKRLMGHKNFSGNRPSNTLLMQRLDPRALGALIALYEHKVYVEAAIWNINPYDQWGVELGKQLASKIVGEIKAGNSVSGHDSSTNGLINRALRQRHLQA